MAFRALRTLCGPGLLLILLAVHARADLDDYVKAPDASYVWRLEATQEIPGVGTVLTLELTSQTWQGIVWKHWLQVLRPTKLDYPDHAMLVISGGRNRNDPPKVSAEAMVLGQVAQRTGSVIAVLSQVPNQPLFGDLKEDALIAHTFVRYFATGDETWPLLLPMTKSAVRAMDAIQAVLLDRFGVSPNRFAITGGSKRGWTTWLAAAVDPRVIAIAPMVIDTLNLGAQMKLQLETFGSYSDEIDEYTRIDLPSLAETPRGRRLLEIVDPYSYRKRLTMPKLIVLGTNDRYWPVDAVRLYYPELEGEKHIHYVANAGHGLSVDALQVVAAFYQSVVAGGTRPRFDWKTERGAGEAKLSVTAADPPEKAELWRATAATRDFRGSKWAATPLSATEDGRFVAALPVPAEGYEAFYVGLTYKGPTGLTFTLCTNVEVVGEKAKVVTKPDGVETTR